MEDVQAKSQNQFNGDNSTQSTNPFDTDIKASEDSTECTADNVENCKCLQRIKSILVECGTQLNINTLKNNNTPCSLLNDFFHIKYHHKIHKNDIQFDKTYSFLTKDTKIKCDISQCQFIQKHFTDRTITQPLINNNDDEKTDNNNEYITDIICRIHTYLFHSYDIYRLSPNDMTQIEKQLNTHKQSDYKHNDNELESIQLQCIFNIIKDKKKNHKFTHNSDKFCEIYGNFNYDKIDLKHNILSDDDDNKSNDDKFTPDQQEKLGQFKMITNADDDVSQKFLQALEWDIGQATDRYFLYNGNVSRLPVVKKKVEKKKDNDDNKDDYKHNNKQAQDHEIYNIGIQFSFWESIKNNDSSEKKYLKAKWNNIKEEMLENENIKCTQQQWNKLHNECLCLVNTDYMRKLGFMHMGSENINVNNVKDNKKKEERTVTIVDINVQHMYALRLYTCYNKWANILCNAFRINNDENINHVKNKVLSVAHWSELLVTVIQRIVDSLDDNKISFYRTGKVDYTFYKLIGRFNVPISASTNVHFIQQCVLEDGMIMELSQYKDNEMDYFDCSAISCFDMEDEVLFFAGDNILQIKSIYLQLDNKLMNYKYYIEAIQNILKLMNGLKINVEIISKYGKILINNILTHILRTSSYKINDLPEYIEKLLNYYLTQMNEQITYNFNDIMNEYIFLKDIFIKKDINIINISNLCNLFKKCKTVIILMSDDFIMNSSFCISLIEDIENISKDITLIFKWSRPMPLSNLKISDGYGKQLSNINWQIHFSSTSIKLTSIAQFASEDEILRQKELLQRYDKMDGQPNSFHFGSTQETLEEKIPLLIHGYIRKYNSCTLLIPLDIINLTIVMYGDYHTIYWKISGANFWELLSSNDNNNNNNINTELVSEPYSIMVLDYSVKFQLKIKVDKQGDASAIILGLYAITDNINNKQAITISYTMICEETQCEYRHMDVIGDGDGSEWFEDFLYISEIQKLNKLKNLKEINFICNINILHIWSQQDEDDDEIELMKIYHNGSKMKQKYNYKWILSQNITPANVTKEYTMYYSPRFDQKNWTLMFLERYDEFMCALKSLSLPFGIGLLVVQCQIRIYNKNDKNKYVSDTILEQFKYGDDDKNIGETKEWNKQELFGDTWVNHFSLSDIIIDCKLEIIHLEGINEEQIFRINWPLYGIECDDHKKFKQNNFVLTKEQFETETFGFNYMIGVLRNEITDLKNEIMELNNAKNEKENKNKKINDGYIINNEKDAQMVKEWLMNTVKLETYFELFMQNGFCSLEIIKEINDKNDLKYIGIDVKAHQIMIMNKINILKKQ